MHVANSVYVCSRSQQNVYTSVYYPQVCVYRVRSSGMYGELSVRFLFLFVVYNSFKWYIVLFFLVRVQVLVKSMRKKFLLSCLGQTAIHHAAAVLWQ